MGQKDIIHIENSNLREIKSIVSKFCINESGKGASFSFQLQSFGKKSHILVFPKATPFDLFCELLFRLDVLSEDKRKVRAYLNVEREENGLPAGCMIYVNATDKSDFAAVDTKGNLYEDDVEAGPYMFKPTGKKACYVPFRKQKYQSTEGGCTFHVTEAKPGLSKRIASKLRRIARSSTTWGCLLEIIFLIGFFHSASLNLRTETNIGKYYIWALVAALIIIQLFKKKQMGIIIAAVFCTLNILTYIPNYYFSKQPESYRAVIEKITPRNNGKTAHCRFENNEIFRVRYNVDEELMHEGDTCLLYIADGLWGMKVCRGVICNGKEVWKD